MGRLRIRGRSYWRGIRRSRATSSVAFGLFSSVNYWKTADNLPQTKGSLTMTAGVVVRPTDDTEAVEQRLFSHSEGSSTTKGWVIGQVTSQYRARIYTSSGLTTLTGGTVTPGLTQFVVISTDGTTASLYVDGVLVNSAAHTNYGTVGTGVACSIGALDGGASAYTEGYILGAYVSSDVAMDASQIATWWGECGAAGTITDPNITSAQEALFPMSLAAGSPASFNDPIQGVTMTRQGTGGTETIVYN